MSDSPAAVLVKGSDGSEIGTQAQPVRTDPTGTTRQPIVLYSADGVAMAVADGVAIPANTLGLLAAGKDVDGKSRFLGAVVDGALHRLMVDAKIASGGASQDVNVAEWIGNATPTVGQKTMAASLPMALASDQSPVPVTISPGGSAPGFSFGDIALAAITTALVTRTALTEQSTNAQRSVVSANASDTSAGTGARQVNITYFDQTGAGPYTETVTLNGTTAVNTVASDICFVEKVEVVSVGSGGVNAGIITLKAATAGGGATIITIAAGDNRTYCAIHYVPTGKSCNISGIACCSNSSVAGNGSVFYVRSKPIGVSTAPKVQVTDFVTVYGQTSNVIRTYGTPIRVVGPASIEAWVQTFVNNSLTYRASVDYYDL